MDKLAIFSLQIGQHLWNNKTGVVICLTSQFIREHRENAKNLSHDELVKLGCISGEDTAGRWYSIGVDTASEWETCDTLLDGDDISPRMRACITVLNDRICDMEKRFSMLRSI